MDAETKRRCFEPFFTTKDVDHSSGLSMSGAGLGLAAAYALARKNGGRLVVDSRPGHGSVFTLYIPVLDNLPSRGDSHDDEIPVSGSLPIAGNHVPVQSDELVQANLRLVAPSALEIEVERVQQYPIPNQEEEGSASGVERGSRPFPATKASSRKRKGGTNAQKTQRDETE